MIVSKANLRVVGITKMDSKIPELNNVHVKPDGTTIGCNGRVIMAVSPVLPEVKAEVPLDEHKLDKSITISAETVNEILKTMPKDTLFKGLLEHCELEDGGDRVKATVKDGVRNKMLEGRKYERPYIDSEGMFSEVLAVPFRGTRFAVNKKRLISLLKALDGITEDNSGETPLFIEVSAEGIHGTSLIFRGTNPNNGQNVVAVMKTYDSSEAVYPQWEKWEKSLVGEVVPTVKKNLPKRRV